MNMVVVYALCVAWVVGVVALIRHEGWLLRVGEQVGLLEAQLEAAFKAAVEEHARRTGGVHVGDTITFDEYEVDVVGYDSGRLVFSQVRPSLQEKP